MSFLCTTRNKEVSYHQCVNECQYFFKSGCIDKMNEAYEQGRADAIDEYFNLISSRINERNRGLYLIEAIEFAKQLKGNNK